MAWQHYDSLLPMTDGKKSVAVRPELLCKRYTRVCDGVSYTSAI